MNESDQLIPDESSKRIKLAFKRHVWLQVYLPLILGVILIGGIVAVLWVAGVGATSVWADSALVMLSIPTLVIGVILLVIMVGLVYGFNKLITLLPAPFQRIRKALKRAASLADRSAHIIVQPVMVPRALRHAVRETFRAFLSIFKK